MSPVLSVAMTGGRWRLGRPFQHPLTAPERMTTVIRVPHQPARLCPVASTAESAGSGPGGQGARRKVTRTEADGLRQIFGPARTSLPRSTPVSRQADAMTALNAIEAATNWRQLVTIFSLVTKLPQNHAHLLAMTIALANLCMPLEVEHQRALSSSPDPATASGQHRSADEVVAEMQEVQRFARELMRATRLPLDAAYAPSDVAMLLRCFCNMGVVPTDNWLYASEAALVVGLQRACEAVQAHGPPTSTGQGSAAAGASEGEGDEGDEVMIAATALLSAAGSYRLCGHEPRPELVQLLPRCASLMWGGTSGQGFGNSLDAEDDDGGVEEWQAPFLSDTPSGEKMMVMMGTGSEWQPVEAEAVDGVGAGGDSGAGEGGGNSGVEGAEGQVDAHYPVPTEVLMTLAHAMLFWDMPQDERWLIGYIQASYMGMVTQPEVEGSEAEVMVGTAGPLAKPDSSSSSVQFQLQLQDMSDLLFALLQAKAYPGEEWLATWQEATYQLLQRSISASISGSGDKDTNGSGKAVGARLCCSLVNLLRELDGAPGSVPSQQWLEAVLACAALSAEPTRPDIIAQLLFDVGNFELQLSSEGRRSLVLLAQQTQMMMLDEEEDKQLQRSGKDARGSLRQSSPLNEEEEQPGPTFSAQGLARLLMSLVRCGLSALDLPQGWLTAWGRRAASLSNDFRPEEMVGMVMAAEVADIQLPVDTVHALLDGQLLGPPKAQYQQEGLDMQRLAALQVACEVHTRYRLPARFLPPLRQIGSQRLQLLRQEQQRLQEQGSQQGDEADRLGKVIEQHQSLSLGLLRLGNGFDFDSTRPPIAELSAWLEELLQGLESAGALRQPALLAEAATALGLHKTAAQPHMHKVEEASLACAPDLTTEHFRHLAAAFAQTGHEPGALWFERLGETCRLALSHKDSEQTAGLGMDLSCILAALCVLRDTASTRHNQAIQAYTMLRNWACQQLATLAAAPSSAAAAGSTAAGAGHETSLGADAGAALMQQQQQQHLEDTATALAVLLPALVATAMQEELPHDACAQLCTLTQQLPGLGGPSSVSCCLDIFNASAFAAPSDWLHLAAKHSLGLKQQQQQEQLGSSFLDFANPDNTCRLLAAFALHEQAAAEASTGASGRRTGQDGYAASLQGQAQQLSSLEGLPALLLAEAGRGVDAFTTAQVVELLKAASALRVRGRLQPGSEASKQLLKGAAASTELQASQLATLLSAAHRLGVPATDSGIQQLLSRLMQPTDLTQQQQQQQQQQQDLMLDVIAGSPESFEQLARALHDLDAQLPAQGVRQLLRHLPGIAAKNQGLAAFTLQYLASQQQWEAEPEVLRGVAQELLTGIASGCTPPPLHSAMLSALAAAAMHGSISRQDGQPIIDWIPATQAAAAVETCGAHLPQYSAEHLCTIVTALSTLGTQLPETWLELFFEYAVPSRCPVALLPGAAMAVASACTQSAGTEATASTNAAASPTSPDALPWLRRVEAAVLATPEARGQITSRDAALLFAAYARCGRRPSPAFVHDLLDLALARAQEEQQQQARLGQGGPGPEAAGVVGLVAAAFTSLGYTPTPGWADRAWDVLSPVVSRIEDARSRQALDAAFAGARLSGSQA